MKKILVIGSNSFSGSDFIDLLLEKNMKKLDYQVIGISRSKEKESLFLPYKNKSRDLKNFKFFQIDLNQDLDKLNVLLDDFKPEYIVNFAAQSEVGPSWDNPHHWFQTNAVALTKLANLLKDKKFLKKYVHISSPEVYGSCEGLVKEDYPMNPSTPYAASKAAGDFSLFTYYKNFGFPLVMIRSTNVYGAYQQLFKIIPRSVINIKKGKKIELHGGGRAIKSYIHIRDISEGELLAMEKGKIGQIYHFSPPQGIQVKELVRLICQKMEVSFEDNTLIAPERLGQDKAYVIDSQKALNELNWKPKISIEQGITETINWIQDCFSDIKNQPLHYVHKT